MRNYLRFFILVLTAFSCTTQRTESVVDENEERKIEKTAEVDTLDNDDSVLMKDSISSNITINENSNSKNKKGVTTRKESKVKIHPIEVMESIEAPKPKRKEPLITKNIEWLKEHMILKYKRVVYPDPEVGCSSSTEEFVIRIPIKKPEESTIIYNERIQKSRLQYNYSGGLHSESSLDLPATGKIEISPLESNKWNVTIDITFPIEEMGGLEMEKREKEFIISGVFD